MTSATQHSVTEENSATRYGGAPSEGARFDARPKRFETITIITGVTFGFAFLLVALPVFDLFYGSFRSNSPLSPNAHFTFDNWIRVYYTGGIYRTAFLNTFAISGTVAFLSVTLGAVIAWILARTDAPWRNGVAIFMVIPLMTSSLVTTLAWIALAAPNAGFINAIFRSVTGVQTLFNIYSFQGIALVMTMHYSSFAFIPIYAAMRSVDSALEEASYVLGVSPWRTALRMTFPLIWPVLVSTFLLVFVFSSENFSVPTILGSSVGVHTLASQIFLDMTVEPAKPPLAATSGTMLLWVALVGVLWQRSIVSRRQRYATISGKGVQARATQLGPWRWAATGFVLLYLFVAVVLPYVTLVFASFLRFVTPRITMNLFTTTNYTRLFTWDNAPPIRNSLLLAALGGLVAAMFYMFLAYLIKRSPGWMARFMDYLVIVPTVVPALVMGIAFVWTYLTLPIPIYGTIWILVVAYITQFMGQGVRQSRAALTQVSDELQEAARVEGASPLRAFWDITLPLVRPHLVSLWTVLFILIFMEISVTIILYSPDSMTLPVVLWQSMSRGFLTNAFAVAVLQATIAFAVLFVADRLFGALRLATKT